MDKHYDFNGNLVDKDNNNIVAAEINNKKYIMIGNDFLDGKMVFNPLIHKNLHHQDKMRSKRFFNLKVVSDVVFDHYLRFLQNKSSNLYGFVERNKNEK